MKRGPQMALAVAGGYVLGRSKRMKLALMLGGFAAGRRIGGSPADLVTEGSKLIGSSPELGRLAEQLRSGLVEAGKSAAAAAAARQVDALSDRLRAHSEALTGAPAPERGEGGSGTSDRSDDSGRSGRSGRSGDSGDSGDSKPSDTQASGDAPGKAARRTTGRSATASSGRAATRTKGSPSRASAAPSRSTAGASGSTGRSADNPRSTASRSRTASGSRDQGGSTQRARRGARRGEDDG